MREEWGDDEGQSAAKERRSRLLAGYRRLREELDAFKPDIVLIWGDDQFENFKRDCVPAFCIGIYDKVVSRPYGGGAVPYKTKENVWGLPPDTELTIHCHSAGARGLCQSLIESGFDPAYSLETRHPSGLAHSFNNTVLYLDYDRKGFDYPIIPFHVNCYGNQLIRTSAAAVGEGANEVSPPSPTAARCFDLGRATARFFAASPWRVALIGLFELVARFAHAEAWAPLSRRAGRSRAFRTAPLQSFHRLGQAIRPALDKSGQHEVLNWICLAGAMSELGQKVEIVDYVESYVFNSSKCFALFPPRKETGGALRAAS